MKLNGISQLAQFWKCMSIKSRIMNNSALRFWKKRLENKIKQYREVIQLTELQKGVRIKNSIQMLKKMQGQGHTPSEALETKQTLIALATRLRGYIRKSEAKNINALFSKEPSKVYSQLQCKIR